jgi:ribosomal protein S6--L-glutamate ligase
MNMRIGIMAFDLEDPDSPELAQTCRDLGYDTTLFFLDDVTSRDNGGVLQTVINDEPATEFDIIISRAELRREHIQADHERYSLLEQAPGVTVLDPADVYLRAESKLLGLQRMGAAGLPVAPTRACRNFIEIAAALADWDAVVIKPSFGYGGTDVERIRNLDEDRALIDGLLAKYEMLLCQPYYPHPDGDIRVTVVGEEAPLSFNRVAQAPKWKSNAKLGAAVNVVTPPPELVDISKKAARVMGLTIAGLDFLPTPYGYRIIEFNTCPGWYPVPEDNRRHVTETIVKVAVSIHAGRRRYADNHKYKIPA